MILILARYTTRLACSSTTDTVACAAVPCTIYTCLRHYLLLAPKISNNIPEVLWNCSKMHMLPVIDINICQCRSVVMQTYVPVTWLQPKRWSNLHASEYWYISMCRETRAALQKAPYEIKNNYAVDRCRRKYSRTNRQRIIHSRIVQSKGVEKEWNSSGGESS